MPAINTQVDRFVASLPPLKAYGTLAGRQAQDRQAGIQRICAALLVDDTIKVMDTPRGSCLRAVSSLGQHPLRHAIGVWKWVSRLRSSRSQMYKRPRDCTREHLDCARTALTLYSARTWVLSGGGLHQQSAATHTLEDVVYARLPLAREAEDLRMSTQKIWAVICPDATTLWRTSVTKCDVFLHYWGDGIQAASDINCWAMWFSLNRPDDGCCLVTIDLEAKLSEQVHHLQSECTYYRQGVRKDFECIFMCDGNLMSVTNGGGKYWEGCRDYKGLHPWTNYPLRYNGGSFKRHQG